MAISYSPLELKQPWSAQIAKFGQKFGNLDHMLGRQCCPTLEG